MVTRRTTIYLSELNRNALAQLQAAYGVSTLSDAIRLAVRMCARALAAQDDASARRRAVVATTQAELTQSQSALAALQAELAAARAALAQLHLELQHADAQGQARVESETRPGLAAEAPAHAGASETPPESFAPSPRGAQLWVVLQQTCMQASHALERARRVLEQRHAPGEGGGATA